MFGKPKIAALVAEFVGTLLLVLAVVGIFMRMDVPFFTAAAAGVVLAAVTMMLGNVAGMHLNPAVTLGLWTLRKIQTTEAAVYIAVQMLAGYLALKLGAWLLGGPISDNAPKNIDWPVFTAEAMGGLVLGLGIAAVVYRVYDNTRMAVVSGLALMVAMLVASLGANGLVNPSLAVGVNAVSVSYLLAPVVGVVLGMNLYAYLFANESIVRRAKVAAAPVATKAAAKSKAKAKTAKKKR